MNPWWVLVCLVIFGIGLTKSGFGAGVGLILAPTMTLAMGHIPGRGSGAALGLMLPLLITGDFLAVWQYRHLFSMNIVKRLLPGTAVGVLIGGYLLWRLKYAHSEQVAEGLIKIEIGFESVVLVGLHWYRLWRGQARRMMPEPLRSHLIGGFSAISSTLAHAAGPIIALYLLPLKLDRQLFVGTCAIYFFILNTCKMPLYYFGGQFANASPLFALQFLPVLLTGAAVGVWLNRRISDKWFSRTIYFVTFVLGWYVLKDGVSHLVAATRG